MTTFPLISCKNEGWGRWWREEMGFTFLKTKTANRLGTNFYLTDFGVEWSGVYLSHSHFKYEPHQISTYFVPYPFIKKYYVWGLVCFFNVWWWWVMIWNDATSTTEQQQQQQHNNNNHNIHSSLHSTSPLKIHFWFPNLYFTNYHVRWFVLCSISIALNGMFVCI